MSAYSVGGHDTPKRLDQTQDGLAGRLRLIDFLTLASYEQYRKALADDPLHQRNADNSPEAG